MWGAYSLLRWGQHKFRHRIQHHVACLSYRVISSPLFILILYLKPYGHGPTLKIYAANLAAFLAR